MNPLAFLYASNIFMAQPPQMPVDKQIQRNYMQWLLEMQQEVAYATYGNQNASSQYQALGKEAQKKLGFTDKECVIIKRLKAEAPNYKYSPACMCNGYIFVKEEFMNKAPMGIKRISLFHETVHKKQFDPDFQSVNVLNEKRFTQIEKEADIYGAECGTCWMCTYQYSFKAPSQKDHATHAEKCKAQGYATKEELLTLTRTQKKNRHLCPYHKRSNPKEELNIFALKEFVRRNPFII